MLSPSSMSSSTLVPTSTPSRRSSLYIEQASGYSCRSPKRARSTPSPKDLYTEKIPSPLSPLDTSCAPLHGQGGTQVLASPILWRTGDGHGPSHAATSPCRSPPDMVDGWARPVHRKREMSVPLLSQTLSHVSLSQTPPPLATRTDGNLPAAMTPMSASSTPPAIATPYTPANKSITPRRWPKMKPISTPGPVGKSVSAAPNTAPSRPGLHATLGSPFNSKRLHTDLPDHQCPTWPVAQKCAKDEWEASHSWVQENDAMEPSVAESQSPLASRADRRSSKATSSRQPVNVPYPSLSSSWGHDTAAADQEGGISTPSFSCRRRPPSRLQLSPADISPLLSKRTPVYLDSSPVQPFPLKRGNSKEVAPSVQFNGGPTPLSSFLPQIIRSAQKHHEPTRTPCQSTFDGLLPDPYAGGLQRRTSDPTPQDSNSFSTFLARCNGERATRSEITHGNSGWDALPSSDDNGLELELSPLRPHSANSQVGPLPGRAFSTSATNGLPASPSASLFSMPRSHKKNGTLTPKMGLPRGTPIRSQSARVPGSARPTIRRGATAPASRVDAPPPQFATPVSQLFGDDKPSPAAFASTGLVKKRGGRLSMPRFSAGVSKAKARILASTGQAPPDQKQATQTTDVPAISTASTDGTQVNKQEDPELDELSPIKPFRTQPFRRSMGHTHARRSSAASISMTNDKGNSPLRRTHHRVSSTASSIGGTRGLRRKSSALLGCGSIGNDSMSDRGRTSPATPTKPLSFSVLQPKFGITTPSPSVAAAQYPFSRARTCSIDGHSPPVSPIAGATRRVRALSRAGPLARHSNPMLAGTFRAHGGLLPNTPTADTAFAEGFVPEAARSEGAGRFENDFTLVQALGNGEFGSVWKVRSKADNELYAVKTGRPYTGARNRLRQLEEVTILKRLSAEPHRHIIKFADSWEQSGRLYIRTELGDCGDLGRYLVSLGDGGGLDEGRVWKMLSELHSALTYIHSNGILHLDFKPSNVLITREGALKVADFGLSVITSLAVSAATSRRGSFETPSENFDDELCDVVLPSPTLDREFEGDREYLCPEALDDVSPGPAADVFSLGILSLEAALNIALPSNGDAWIKLRNDDFSDLEDHYTERDADEPMSALSSTSPSSRGWCGSSVTSDQPASVISSTLLGAIKGMMTANPMNRLTLEELGDMKPLIQATNAVSAWRKRKEEELSGVKELSPITGWMAAGPALVEEEGEFVGYLLR